jgi:hypothetical protein
MVTVKEMQERQFRNKEIGKGFGPIVLGAILLLFGVEIPVWWFALIGGVFVLGGVGMVVKAYKIEIKP